MTLPIELPDDTSGNERVLVNVILQLTSSFDVMRTLYKHQGLPLLFADGMYIAFANAVAALEALYPNSTQINMADIQRWMVTELTRQDMERTDDETQ